MKVKMRMRLQSINTSRDPAWYEEWDRERKKKTEANQQSVHQSKHFAEKSLNWIEPVQQ